MKRIFPDHAAALERSVAGLSKAEKEQAIHLLRKLGVTAAASIPGAAQRASAGTRSSAGR
jgi:hypothetical protein